MNTDKILIMSAITCLSVIGFIGFANAEPTSYNYPKFVENVGYTADSNGVITDVVNVGNESSIKALAIKIDVYSRSNILYDVEKSVINMKEFQPFPIYLSDTYNIRDYMYPYIEDDTYFVSLITNENPTGINLTTDDMGNDQHWINSIIASNFEYPTDSIKVKTTLYYIEQDKIKTISSIGELCPEKCIDNKSTTMGGTQ